MRVWKTTVLSCMAVFILVLAGCTKKESGELLTLVKSAEVCMINNTFFGKEQIPVPVGGTLYYGCCENCKKTLANDPKSRVAIDPISKNEVDKAAAFIGAAKNGSVYYFESKANLDKFRLEKPTG